MSDFRGIDMEYKKLEFEDKNDNEKQKCCLCGKTVYNNNTRKVYKGKVYHFCEECRFCIDNLDNWDSKVKIESRMQNIDDLNLKDYLTEILLEDENPTKYNSNTFWTKFLRTISTINLICGIIIGLYAWYYIADNIYIAESLGFFVGVIIILLTMMTTAGIMIFVEMSENIANNKKNTDKLLEILNNKK